jgi:AraC-like DNA-binding protein
MGERWLPSSVDVSEAAPETLRAQPLLGEVEIRQVTEITAVGIPHEQLSARVACTDGRRAGEGGTIGAFDPDSLDFAESLRLVMRGYARVGSLTLDRATQAAGVSRRTLQRWLRNHGMTYSELADRVRFEIASDMLRHHTQVSVTRIGYELGFSDPGSFSRAFRRFAGVAPVEYRRQATCAAAGS